MSGAQAGSNVENGTTAHPADSPRDITHPAADGDEFECERGLFWAGDEVGNEEVDGEEEGCGGGG